MVKCPDYANVGCFTSIRRTETDGNNNADDVIRGCSSFVEEYACAVGTQSNADDGTSNSFTTCKEWINFNHQKYHYKKQLNFL